MPLMASQALSTPASPSAAPPAASGSAAAPGAAQPSAALPAGIEIFRAGTHRDDSGNTHTFTRAQLEEMAATYNTALREAPLTVGHPKDNLPAYGWVQRVYINDAGNLAVDPHQVDPAFAAMVRDGRFKKRSASFYPPGAPHNPTPGKWYLRHVAFLGAQPPAVAGLKDIGFAEFGDLAEAVSFSESPTHQPPQEPSMSVADQAELERLRAESKANNEARAKAEADAKAANERAAEAQRQAASFAEKAAADRRAGFVSFAESEIKAGRLLPKDKHAAVAALETLASAATPMSFSEGNNTTQVSPLEMCAWLQGQMSSRNPVVSFGEMATGGVGDPNAFDARGKSDAEIDQAARRYQAEHPTVSYAEALGKVVSFGA